MWKNHRHPNVTTTGEMNIPMKCQQRRERRYYFCSINPIEVKEVKDHHHDNNLCSTMDDSTTCVDDRKATDRSANKNMNPKKLLVRGGKTAITAALSKFHPVFIEGMGGYDPRDPVTVAKNVYSDLQSHWSGRQPPITKPKLVVIQGDPLEERGISAITPEVSKMLDVSRGLVCLDDDIADYHSPNADRTNVSIEFRYSDLVQILESERPGVMASLEDRIDQYLKEKNAKRKTMDKPPLKDYFRDFALLQEVTKAACRQICGELTVAHTQNHIYEFSVTSFYKAGLELGLVDEETDMVYYSRGEEFDFEKIDKR